MEIELNTSGVVAFTIDGLEHGVRSDRIGLPVFLVFVDAYHTEGERTHIDIFPNQRSLVLA